MPNLFIVIQDDSKHVIEDASRLADELKKITESSEDESTKIYFIPNKPNTAPDFDKEQDWLLKTVIKSSSALLKLLHLDKPLTFEANTNCKYLKSKAYLTEFSEQLTQKKEALIEATNDAEAETTAAKVNQQLKQAHTPVEIITVCHDAFSIPRLDEHTGNDLEAITTFPENYVSEKLSELLGDMQIEVENLAEIAIQTKLDASR